jgi:2-polyprenyl-6-methoxyphenol hydroxylase-like FAD-dependent oxidoreductase
MSDVDHDVDVIIVGGGPVGVCAGLLLRREQVSVCILEKGSEVYYAPRAVVLDPQSMRMFRDIDEAMTEFMNDHTGPHLEREVMQRGGVRNGYPGQPFSWYIAGGPSFYAGSNTPLRGTEWSTAMRG